MRRWLAGGLLGVTLTLSSCGGPAAEPMPGPAIPEPPMTARMKGMTEAGYSPTVFNSPAVRQSIVRLHEDGVNWLAIQVAWFQANNQSTVIRPSPIKTPTDASVTALIQLAHHEGMRVFLNPFVNSFQGNGWQALFHPASVPRWFHSFDAYIAHYAKLASQDHADLFSIGDEFDTLDHVPRYTPYWIQAIRIARRYYHGPITYGADYPDYQQVTFWPALNDVGVDAYFPLSNEPNPSVATLVARWNQIANSIEAWRRNADLAQKPFLITELGYPSEDGAAATPGTWYPHQPVNLALQQKLYLATFESIWQRPWLKGIMWFWWANPSNPDWQGGPRDNGYTIRNKPAELVLREFFTGASPGVVPKHGAGRQRA
ncbi:MAG: hypothetical protein OWU84_12860 [Firmicutes bacterium]|nr:hypothetical protein [Bacillota bacterium]